MKGLWILGGIAAGAVALGVALGRDSRADVDRKYEETVRERPVIEQALAEATDLVGWFEHRKPVERKKTELSELRARLDALDRSALTARDDGETSAERRKEDLAELERQFWQLKRDAEDLRARLREMKNYDDALRPRVVRLAALTRALAEAQSTSTDPEFQQRSAGLIEEGRKFRTMAEGALKTLSHSIAEGRAIGMTALNELDSVMERVEEILTAYGFAVPDAAAAQETAARSQ